MVETDNWRWVFRTGLAPHFTDEDLSEVALALADNNQALIQSYVTVPFNIYYLADEPISAACFLGFTVWKNLLRADPATPPTVGEVYQGFTKLCEKCDHLLNEKGGVKYFIEWFAAGNREAVFREVLKEVRDEQHRRSSHPGQYRNLEEIYPHP